MTTLADPPALDAVPGALREHKTRTLPDGGLIEFEQAPAGWLTADGEVRRRDHRAYYFTPGASACEPCEGSGRVPGKRAGTTKQCPNCKGSGEAGKRSRLPSVTTLLDAICPKPGIPPWSEARGIEGTVEAIRRGLIDPDDPASAAMAVGVVRAHRLGADRARDEAAGRGLNVHGCLEHYLRTGEPPNPADHPVEHWGFLRGLTRFLLRANPEPDGASVEQLVAHPECGYAGRLDFRARCGGLLVTYDLKTQERGGIYLGAHLQVNLYERAELRCGGEPADLLKVVVVAANGEFREMAADHRPELIDAALDFYRECKPVDSVCASHNRFEVEARKAAA
jgi:hypothetical protein